MPDVNYNHSCFTRSGHTMQTRYSFAQLLQMDHEYCAGLQTSISSVTIGLIYYYGPMLKHTQTL